MSAAVTIKDIALESQLFKSRAVVAGIVTVGLTIILLARLVHLQVLEYEHFKTLSDDNRVKIVPVPPTRGLIFDRNGVVLAQNTPTYSLELVPESVKDIPGLIEELKAIIDIKPSDEERFYRLLKKRRRFQNIPIRLRLNEQEVARFSVNRHRFPDVDVHARLSRDYPLGALAVHLIGYVGRISEPELGRIDATNYRGTSYIGKTGVEQAFESLLHGRVGYQHVETNAAGRTVRVLQSFDPVPGSDLHLTIDAELQAHAEQALAGEPGAIVAMEPATGDILAFVSLPGFDPNLFVDGIDVQTYRDLLTSSGRPLFNRALNGQYPPGSTVKPFIALAGLERKVDFSRKDTWCRGFYRLPGKEHRYRDWKKGGHGRVGLHRAIVESCDVYFYELALRLGIDRMHEFMSQLGFGIPTGVSLSSERAGLMPSRAWKRRARNQPWYPGETLISGIGQGFMLATPLQLASATSTLATRGLRVRPRVVASVTDPRTGTRVPLGVEALPPIEPRNEKNWELVIDAMTDVVHGRRGTARRIGLGATYRMAGKTGTSQVFSVGQDEEYEADKLAKKLRDHALFVAFAPVDKPSIALSILVENGGSGSRAAAPIARKVLDKYLRREGIKNNGDKLLLTRSQFGNGEPYGTAIGP